MKTIRGETMVGATAIYLRAWRALRLAAALGGTLVTISPAVAQTAWPARQLTLMVPYPPGGYIDLVTRILAEGLRERSGQTVVVLNKTGGNGQVALGDLSRAAPDGYTLLTNNDGGIGLPPAVDRGFRFTPVTDYAPIAQVVEADYILVVRAGLPIRTIAELIGYAKSASKPLTYASPGLGSTPHIGMALFAREAGLDLIHVPYTGSAPAINDLVAGQVDCYLASMPTVVGHLGGDRIRGLATTGAKRAPETPATPTMHESGLSNIEIAGWLGLFGPPATPDALRAEISKTVAEVIHAPKIEERLRAASAAPITRDSADFGPFYLAEIARWKAFSDETGIKVGD